MALRLYFWRGISCDAGAVGTTGGLLRARAGQAAWDRNSEIVLYGQETGAITKILDLQNGAAASQQQQRLCIEAVGNVAPSASRKALR
jgi:hypothetical protein